MLLIILRFDAVWLLFNKPSNYDVTFSDGHKVTYASNAAIITYVSGYQLNFSGTNYLFNNDNGS